MTSVDDEESRTRNRPIHCVLLSTLIFQSLLVGRMTHSAGRPATAAGPAFSAQSDPSCAAAAVSQDTWSCDLARAEFLLRGGRSCHSAAAQSRAAPQPQCLVLSNSSAAELCSESPRRQRQLSRQLTLTFCHKYSLNLLLRRDDWIGRDPAVCRDRLTRPIRTLLHRDLVAGSLSCEFDALLSRYNCHTGYSVKWNCSQCISTYKDWICSTVLQYFQNGHLVRPCVSVCERVEQRCPYFHPWYKDQYAGEPAFICIDPQIPFVPALTSVTPHGEPGMCYDVCDLVQSRQDNCTTDYSDSDCGRQRSSTASSPISQKWQNTTTSNKQSPHVLPVDQQADDDAEVDDEVADISIEAQADEDVDDELENSSTLTTETVTRLRDGGRDKS